MEIDRSVIRPKSMIIVTNGAGVLATKGYDTVKDEHFYRLIGGSLNVGETGEQCIRREVQEELGCGLDGLERIDVIENIFQYNAELCHEIIFLYRGELCDHALYQKESITIIEPFAQFEAIWVPLEDIITERARLYPAYSYQTVLASV